MNASIDTSALVKVALREPESALVDAAWAAASTLLVSRIAYPEARAAIAAAERAGRLAASARETARAELERRWAQCVVVDVTDEIAVLAGDLAEEQALRGCDAIHLATAAVVADPDLLLVTWDRQLSAAAERLGIATEPRFG